MSRVGRLFGKLFSGQPQTDGGDVPLRAYGKLPMYAEYRRLEVSPGEPTGYSQWMDAGRLASVKVAAQRGDKGAIVSSRLFIQLPGVKQVVVASIWDSRDNVGRIFPFSFFVVCPPEALGNDPFARWTSAVSVFEQFDRAYAELRVLRSGGDFYRLFRGRTVQVKPDGLVEQQRALLEQAAQIDAQDWFEALNLNSVTPADWFSSLVRRGGRWARQPEDVAQLSLGCPLADGFSFDAQAMLWLRWIEPFALKARKIAWLIAPGQRDGPARSAYLILRDLIPDDFQLLTSHARDYGFVDHLAAAPQGAAAGQTAAGQMAAVVPPRGSLLNWLASTASAQS